MVDGQPLSGTLTYVPSEYAFTTTPKTGSVTSLLVNDVNLAVDDNGLIVGVWGLCPHPNWERRVLLVPEAVESRLSLIRNDLTPGVAERMGERRTVFVDQDSGWVCIGDPEAKGPQTVQFSPGAMLVFRGRNVLALWLRPATLPD